MSFFLATVPEGVILHHGNNNEKSPDDPDWLAFEIEHAENFARGRPGPRGPGGRPHPPPSARSGNEMHPIVLEDDGTAPPPDPAVPSNALDDGAPPEERRKGGWLHTYRAARPLRYLYIDGMSGGKTTMGTLDSQDFLLRGTRTVYDLDNGHGEEDHAHERRPGGPMDEKARAVELCALCKDWNLSGVIRMEAGFEIIQCDFYDGLDELQALQRPSSSGGDGGGPGRGGIVSFEYMRALAERYQDIGSSRVLVDYSSMVSAYFFPINITNPDPKRPDLARLSHTTDAELAGILAYLNTSIQDRFNDAVRTIDWRDVTDLIVGRYADRIKYMADKASSASQIADEVNVLLTTFIDFSGKETDLVAPAIERCASFYLHGVKPVTEADKLVHAALRTVSSEICTRLFDVREVVVIGEGTDSEDDNDNEDAANKMTKAVTILSSLMEYLDWARFKRCPPCDVDEVCFIPMWPMGSKGSYESPSCVNSSHMDEGESYWGGFGGGPGRPGRGPGGGKGGPGGPPP